LGFAATGAATLEELLTDWLIVDGPAGRTIFTVVFFTEIFAGAAGGWTAKLV